MREKERKKKIKNYLSSPISTIFSGLKGKVYSDITEKSMKQN